MVHCLESEFLFLMTPPPAVTFLLFR